MRRAASRGRCVKWRRWIICYSVTVKRFFSLPGQKASVKRSQKKKKKINALHNFIDLMKLITVASFCYNQSRMYIVCCLGDGPLHIYNFETGMKGGDVGREVGRVWGCRER